MCVYQRDRGKVLRILHVILHQYQFGALNKAYKLYLFGLDISM